MKAALLAIGVLCAATAANAQCLARLASKGFYVHLPYGVTEWRYCSSLAATCAPLRRYPPMVTRCTVYQQTGAASVEKCASVPNPALHARTACTVLMGVGP